MCRERRSTKHRRTKKNGEHIMANISRRNFMKVAAGAAGIAGLGLLNGCSKTEAPASSAAASAAGSAAEGTTTPAAAAPATDKLYTASINPQLDESEFRSNTKELTTLFSPLTIGSMEISNRMVKSAAGSATYLAGLTDELLTYYVNLAKGGVALIYVETIAALEVPEGGSYDADTLAFGQKLVDECHKYGAKMGYQMSGFGMGENDMTIDDIHAKQTHFVEVAKGLQQMGFDCVELNCAGFNMPAHFLSRFHNTRTDEYGIGSIENRARFITEIIEGVKKECGPDFNMQILINCIEENDNISNNPTMMTLDSAVTTPHTLAMTMEEGIAAAKLFEQAGCDSMHLRLGPLGHHVAQFGADLYFILNGIEGETREYNGTDYTYYGTSDCVVTENDDGTVTYDIKLRDDLKFSDGEPVTIDDVIFSMYVFLDPTYDGSVTMYSTPIVGLEEYRNSMSTLSKLIAEAGEDNTDYTNFTEEQQKAFWDAVNDGGVKFAQEIVDNMMANGATDVASAAAGWGFDGLAADATAKDFFLAIGDNSTPRRAVNLSVNGSQRADSNAGVHVAAKAQIANAAAPGIASLRFQFVDNFHSPYFRSPGY